MQLQKCNTLLTPMLLGQNCTSRLRHDQPSLASSLCRSDKISRPLLDFMTKTGSESATVSGVCRAWLTIEQHYASLKLEVLSRFSGNCATDLSQLQALMATRVKDRARPLLPRRMLLQTRCSQRHSAWCCKSSVPNELSPCSNANALWDQRRI
jgi:hypothetical protein